MTLFHITTREAWNTAQRVGEYVAPSLASQGFIHLSTDQQWPTTAKRFYRGQPDLVILAIRADLLRAPVRYEPADGDHFPHLYGALDLEAVYEILALTVDDDGRITTTIV